MLHLRQKKFTFQKFKSSSILKLLRNVEVNEAAGIDKISGRFLKDGADVLTILKTQICNPSVKLSHNLTTVN